MIAALADPIFTDAEKAREALDAVRWPNGPVCPHCGSVERIAKVEGIKKSHRPGLYFCNACQGQFTVTVRTVFEDSKVPLNKWWMAVLLVSSSKKGISSHQLHRLLGVSYKTAKFMTHRIREAMRSGELGPMGGGGAVEADETFIGREPGKPKKRACDHEVKALPLVDRTTKGVYRHCGKEHLHGSLAEFDFRYNDRSALGCGRIPSAPTAPARIEGKRLTYQQANEAPRS